MGPAGRRIAIAAAAVGIVSFVISIPALRAQDYEIYKQFAGTGASDPQGPLIQGPDGLYGTTSTGGSGDCDGGGFLGCGTIYRLEPNGDVTILHEFQVGEGRPSIYPLVRASDGNLYGTTYQAGQPPCPCGTVYRLDPQGNFDTIHTFQGDDGIHPTSGLIEPVAGELWGTTGAGGPTTSTACAFGCGTVYRIHFDGGFTTMHALDESDEEGDNPTGNLVLASDGDLYGVTASGGTGFNGTFFKITLNGNWTTIVPLPTGFYLSNGLILAPNGDFIGTTFTGGAFGLGSVYRLTASGESEILHSMAEDGLDGYYILATVVEADDGYFYGSAFSGSEYGTLFRVDLDGNFEVVHDFHGGTDGSGPRTAMTLAADGNLYGTTTSESGGIVYRLDVGPPPVYFCPTSPVRRDQMAVFLLKIIHDAAYTPPDCTPTFGDVPCPSLFAAWIQQLAAEGITAGCAGGNYCPAAAVTRAQMAVFLLKTEHGAAYTPPACTGLFPDVPCPSLFAPWVEQLAAEGITGGCGSGVNYCPGSPVTRAQMSVFLLKLEHGGAYSPPACQNVFGDVVCPSLFAPWIEQLYAEQITGGCGGPS